MFERPFLDNLTRKKRLEESFYFPRFLDETLRHFQPWQGKERDKERSDRSFYS